MKKKLLFIVVAIIAFALVFAACDGVNIAQNGSGVSGDGSISGDGAASDGSGSASSGDGSSIGGEGSGEDSLGNGSSGNGGSSGSDGSDPASDGGATDAYVIDGDYLYFGTYPQSEVTDATLKSVLTEQAGVLPAEGNQQGWTPYQYYYNGELKAYTWYVDVTDGEDHYRGVYFTSYRPYSNDVTTGDYQRQNGYRVSEVYWFKYEPIKWRILQQANGVATILCASMLDSQPFYRSDDDTRTGRRPNSYEYSDIRAWLNGAFFESFFTEAQRAIILPTELDNSARSTNPKADEVAFNAGRNNNAGNATTDTIYLLSVYEATDGGCGFVETNRAADTSRVIIPTDYAKAMGAYNGRWWLRSPAANNVAEAYVVNATGVVYDRFSVDNTNIGVVPAMRITL